MFSVTYEIVTPESAENHDVEERGYVVQNVGLREAINHLFETRTKYVSGIESVEPNDGDILNSRWITVYNGMEFYTGAQESRSLHIPDNVTDSTRARIVRLFRYYI